MADNSCFAAPSNENGLRSAKPLLSQGRERSSSPLRDFQLSRRVTWLEPTSYVEVTSSETLMKGRPRDPEPRCRLSSSSGIA
jgi:hypothetical protein